MPYTTCRFLRGSATGAALTLALTWALVVSPLPALAFSIVTPDGSSQGSSPPAGSYATPYATPQFDLEEQMRQFRTEDGGRRVGDAVREFDTPFGKGKVEFGVGRDYGMFGSPFGFSGFNSFRAQQDRRHMDRMLAPPGLQHQYDR